MYGLMVMDGGDKWLDLDFMEPSTFGNPEKIR